MSAGSVQPTTPMLPEDIRTRIAADFGGANAAKVEADLSEFAEVFRAQSGSPLGDRLIRCMLHNASGDWKALARQMKEVLVDWRDVIVAAEYNERGERARDFNLPFELRDAQADGPASNVTAFIRAMNDWELNAWEASRRARGTTDPESYWPEVTAGLQRVFGEFCTPGVRTEGREETFQQPPEYDPKTERIIGTGVTGDEAYVDTERDAPLGGLLRYVLRRRGGRWLVDGVKRKDGDDWMDAVL
jgi:hypothetical protein